MVCDHVMDQRAICHLGAGGGGGRLREWSVMGKADQDLPVSAVTEVSNTLTTWHTGADWSMIAHIWRHFMVVTVKFHNN